MEAQMAGLNGSPNGSLNGSPNDSARMEAQTAAQMAGSKGQPKWQNRANVVAGGERHSCEKRDVASPGHERRGRLPDREFHDQGDNSVEK
jgi:hypothetical protein